MMALLRLLKNGLFARAKPRGAVSTRLKEIARLLAHGHNQQAYVLAEALLEERTNDAEAMQFMGLAAMAVGESELAYICFSRSVLLCPEDAVCHNNFGYLLSQLGRTREARTSFRKALEINPAMTSARTNLVFTLIMMADEKPESVCKEHMDWAEIHAEPHLEKGRKHANSPDPERLLRIGYVSADFRLHALTMFIDPVFENFDRKCFRTYCYYNGRIVDEMTDSIRRRVDGFREVADLDDDALAESIRSDGIDILIDLSGHLRGNRLLVFARRPAPIQMTYLAYPGTTGMSAMNFRITDRRCDPPGEHDHHYRETLLWLPDCLWCFSPPRGMPKVAPLPALTARGVTFASTNALVKVSEEMLETWSDILLKVPDSRLILVTVPPRERSRILAVFENKNVDISRVTTYERMPRENFWDMYSRIDILLDTFPCNGGTTTCEALWMGVPAVSLRGDVFQSRAGYSILSSIGLDDWVAMSRSDYVEKAARLASDRNSLAKLRKGLRLRMSESVLLDAAGFTRKIQHLYRAAWRDWCGRHSEGTIQ